MPVQIAAYLELLGAQVAAVTFLSAVNKFDVLGQRIQLCKGLAAVGTLKRVLSVVSA